MSKGSGEKTKKMKVNKKKKKEQKEEQTSRSAAASGRGERDRAKWRKKRKDEELQKAMEMPAEQRRAMAEAEFAKRRGEQQKREFRKRHEKYTKNLDAATEEQKNAELVMTDYRESRNAIKVRLVSDSNDVIQTQQLEKAHLIQVSERIRNSEVQLANLELELSKTKKFNQDYTEDSLQNWFVRFWKVLY